VIEARICSVVTRLARTTCRNSETSASISSARLHRLWTELITRWPRNRDASSSATATTASQRAATLARGRASPHSTEAEVAPSQARLIMSEPHAVLGMYQLSRLDEFITQRQKIAQIYDESLAGLENCRPLELPENMRSNYYKYIAFLRKADDRQHFKQTLRETYEVFCGGEVYELPCHLQPVFKNLYGLSEGDFPMAEDLCARHICLPMYATMTEEEAEYVVKSVKEVA